MDGFLDYFVCLSNLRVEFLNEILLFVLIENIVKGDLPRPNDDGKVLCRC